FDSADWSAPNGFAELTRYVVHPDLEPVDVPRRLLDWRGEDPAGEPVLELVLVPHPPDGVLVLGRRGDAVIERRPVAGDPRAFEYRYRVVERIARAADGEPVLLDGAPDAGDPLGYRESLPAGFLGSWHDDRAWLEATVDTDFPDAVCAFSHHLLSDPRRDAFAPERRYDAFVVAARGKSIGPRTRPPSVDHGAPYREAMRIPFLVAGPGVAQGVTVRTPARILDVAPTVLDLLGVPIDASRVDGRPVRGIWAEPDTEAAV